VRVGISIVPTGSEGSSLMLLPLSDVVFWRLPGMASKVTVRLQVYNLESIATVMGLWSPRLLGQSWNLNGREAVKAFQYLDVAILPIQYLEWKLKS
jgi:hypothetical protein